MILPHVSIKPNQFYKQRMIFWYFIRWQDNFLWQIFLIFFSNNVFGLKYVTQFCAHFIIFFINLTFTLNTFILILIMNFFIICYMKLAILLNQFFNINDLIFRVFKCLFWNFDLLPETRFFLFFFSHNILYFWFFFSIVFRSLGFCSFLYLI